MPSSSPSTNGYSCLVRLRYSYRVYPTPGQQAKLAKAFGCARVVFNDGLRVRQRAREQGLAYVADGELSRQVITEAGTHPKPHTRQTVIPGLQAGDDVKVH